MACSQSSGDSASGKEICAQKTAIFHCFKDLHYYSQPDEQGEYGRIFEEEYEQLKDEYLGELALDNEHYRKYLADIQVGRTHNDYFAIDKRTRKLTDPNFKTRGEEAGLSADVDAYDLILKDKERLLSFEEPVRFIFSHSALRYMPGISSG